MLLLQGCRPGVASLTRSTHFLSGRFSRFHTETDILHDLEERGFVSQVTSRDKLKNVLQKPQVVYLGVDPTAEYLHVGHLLPFLSLFHFQVRGHRVIPLIGGATGLIGDPSGRNTERPLSDAANVQHNVSKLTTALNTFFESAIRYAEKRFPTSGVTIIKPDIQSNLNWLQGMGLLEFLRAVGVHARVNTMIARESVQARLASQQGISFTEFTYQLLQAYDFYHLHEHESCTIQIGGSDQWGNILAGIDLINRVKPSVAADGSHEEKVFAITTPLLTTASGAKFGKSAGNAVALDKRITSIFDFYQFFLRTPDVDVGHYLKIFTLLPISTIESTLEKHQASPENRIAQRLLAAEVTELVHGVEAVQKAQLTTKVLYESDLSTVKADDVLNALQEDPRLRFFSETEVLGTPVAKLAATSGLIASNSAARQLVASKGLYLNNKPVQDIRQKITKDDLLDGRLAIVRAGSQKQIVLAMQ